MDSLPLIVNPLAVGRGGQPPGEKPAGDGNVDIRILTSHFGLFILLPGKRTLAILLTGSDIPEGEAGASVGPIAPDSFSLAGVVRPSRS